MTVIHDILLSLETGQILRRQGIRQYSSVRPEIEALIGELLVSTKDDHLLEPAIAYEIYPITKVDHHQLSLAGDTLLHGPLLTSLLSNAEEIAALVCTIGPKLENQVTDCLGRSELLRGLLLDGIGNAAMDSLTQEVCKLIMSAALRRGYQTSSPFSPGMHGFPITEQWQLFQLVPAQQIGVSLTASGIMVPRKSASTVIGIGQQVTIWKQAEVCARCNLSRTCHYRLAGEYVNGWKLRSGRQ